MIPAQSKMRVRSRRGMTFIETVVYLIVFSLFLVVVLSAYAWYRNSQQGTVRLDVLHQLRQGMRCSPTISHTVPISALNIAENRKRIVRRAS